MQIVASFVILPFYLGVKDGISQQELATTVFSSHLRERVEEMEYLLNTCI